MNELWHHGTRNDVSVVTDARVRYVAGYIDKKYFGDLGSRAYRDVEPPFQLYSKSLGIDFATRNYEQILYDGMLKIGKGSYPVPKVYLDHIGKQFPAEVDGVKIKLYESAVMYGLEWLLENFPQFGGKSYEQLDDDERVLVSDWVEKDNSAYYRDLIAGIKQKGEARKGDKV